MTLHANNKKIVTALFIALGSLVIAFFGYVYHVSAQGMGQLGPLPFKDIDCDGYEDVTNLDMLGKNAVTRKAWGLICPGKVDINCDGRSDQNGTIIYNEEQFERQCPGGYSTKNRDLDCDGFDDRYPNIDVRKTDYWRQICPDTSKFVDANCDGFDDVRKFDYFADPDTQALWRSLCPGKVDRNCDGHADISGVKYFREPAEIPNPEEFKEFYAADYRLNTKQCPRGYTTANRDKDCDGMDDTPVYYTVVRNADGTTTREPVSIAIDNTTYWKMQYSCNKSLTFTDANCDGIDDTFKFNLLEKGFKEEWKALCPGKVDLNCDGRSDQSGHYYDGGADRNGKAISLVEEPHYKYQCPPSAGKPYGFSIENRDKDCDGIDDFQIRVKVPYLDPATGQVREVEQLKRIDISNTDYWKNVSCAEVAGGVVGKSPLQPYGGNKLPANIKRSDLSCADISFRFDSFGSIVCTIRNLVGRVFVPFAILIATLFFIYGVIKYFIAADSTAARQEGRRFMMWSLLALFVMLSVWGIVRLATDTLGFEFSFPPQLKEK